MPWSRASELSRTVACPASAHLPRVEDTEGSEASEWGTLVHAWSETGKWPVNNPATRRRAAVLKAAGLSRDALWPPGSGDHEVTYALSTAARLSLRERLPDKATRDAWCRSKGPEWLTGTADWVGDWFGEPWIEDLKTGKGHPIDYHRHAAGEIPADGGDPWDLWQLRFYAIAEVLQRGWTGGVWVSVLWWPRFPADSRPVRIGPRRIDHAEISGLTLPLLEMARRRVVESWDRPIAVPGDHCKFCRARAFCPALAPTADKETRTE